MHPALWALIGAAIGAAACYALLIVTGKNIVQQAKTEANQHKQTSQIAAEAKAREIALAAQEEQRKAREQLKQESDATKREIAPVHVGLLVRPLPHRVRFQRASVRVVVVDADDVGQQFHRPPVCT